MAANGGVVKRLEEGYVCDTTTIRSFLPSTSVASSGIDALPSVSGIADVRTSGLRVGIERISGYRAETKDSLESTLRMGCVRLRGSWTDDTEHTKRREPIDKWIWI